MKDQISAQNFLLVRLLEKIGKERPIKQLTERELSCLFLAAKGLTTNETAELLGIKSSTVETYRRKIKYKLACNTMAQAVFEGIRWGYMDTRLAV